MSHGKPYSLYRRNRIYYVRFKLPNGRWSTAKSTGETSKGNAERWAFNYLSAGQIVHRENVTLTEYSKDFFAWDGSWATDKRVRGLRISRRQCFNLAYLLNAHLLPSLGEMKLTAINRSTIRDLRNNLYHNGYSGNTINKVLSALKSILATAEDQSLIQFVPKIERAAVNPKQKGILTMDEVRQLFATEWKSDPAHCHPAREQFMGYVANLLASSTGLRMGEIQALTISDAHCHEGYIYVRRSWDRKFGLNETTKTGRTRTILIPTIVQMELQRLISLNPENNNPDSFIFFSEAKQGKPAEPKIFMRALYTAMRRIGISEAERKKRNITFHSWRHWFNSLLINARIPLQKVQTLTGHLTSVMTQHYYHLDDMQDVRQIQETIFSNQPNTMNII